MPKGGVRPGSGRKKGEKSKLAELYNAELARQVEEEKKPIIEALLKKAKEGDIPAIKEIHERLMGKVSQPLSGDKDNPFTVKTIIINKNGGGNKSDTETDGSLGSV